MFRNKALPYPLLDPSDIERDDYLEASYQTAMRHSEPAEDGTVTFEFNHNCSVLELKELVEDKKAAYCVVIKCSDTCSREAFLSFEKAQKLTIPMHDFYGKVDFMPQIVAVEAITNFSAEHLNSEFEDATFDLKPGDILAVDEISVRFFEFDTLSFESLFRVRRSDDIDEYAYEIDLSENLVSIVMGNKLRDLWDVLRQDIGKRPFLVMSIYKDCFYHALELLASEEDDVLERRWARALSQKLEELGESIPEQEYNPLNMLAQKILEQDSLKLLEKMADH